MSLETLQEYGLEEMTEREIKHFLTHQRAGVLGLSTESGPYLLPLSFGFDGDGALYFTYLVGSESQKATLSERNAAATFLVYDVESSFTWRSVLVRGELSPVPEDEWDNIEEILDEAWRPDVLETAQEAADVAVYEFGVTDWSGIKHTGLPPGMR